MEKAKTNNKPGSTMEPRAEKGAKPATFKPATGASRTRATAMPMQLTITTVGTSAGIILPKAALQQLRAEKGHKLYVSEAPGGGVRLSRFDPDFERQMKHAYEAMDLYPDALKELAK